MGYLQPVTNLRDYVSQNPPGVTFFLCLLTLALSFISLSYYGNTHTLPNPDVTKDWNSILSSLSQLQLCTQANVTLADPGPAAASPLQAERGTGGVPSAGSSEGPRPVTRLHLNVPLAVTHGSASQPAGGLSTSLTANQLGLVGSETVNLTLKLVSPPDANDTYTCLTIAAPEHLLPMTLLPPECPVNERAVPSVHVISIEKSNLFPVASQTCYSLESKHDPTLTAMLTKDQQRVAGQHLLEVSVCLLGVCLMLCLSASLTHSSSRRHTGNGLDLQREPLIDS